MNEPVCDVSATDEIKEWSMGNGQCPKCYGVPESWLGHPLFLESGRLGHKKEYSLAARMNKLGLDPLYIGESILTTCYEHHTSNEGFWGTREIRN